MASFGLELKALDRPREPTLAQSLMDPHGVVAVGQVARVFGMSAAQVAASLGLPSEAVHKSARMASPKTQRRPRECWRSSAASLIGRAGATGDGLVPQPADPGLWRPDGGSPGQGRQGLCGARLSRRLALGGFA